MSAFQGNTNLNLPRWDVLHLNSDNRSLSFGGDLAISQKVLSEKEKLGIESYSSDERILKIIRDAYTLSEGKIDNDKGLVAIWNNYKVYITRATFYSNNNIVIQNNKDNKDFSYVPHLTEISQYPAIVLYPIDSRMTKKDIAFATNFYPNESTTGWMFSHCNQNYHRDFEYHITSALDSVFWKEKDLIQDVADGKLYSLFIHGHTDSSRAAWGDATRRLDTLRQFHSQVELAALIKHKSKHLGYYHQHPNDSHIHELLTSALREVKAKWEADNDVLAAWLSIKDAVNRMIERTSILYQYKTRWEIAAEAEEETEE